MFFECFVESNRRVGVIVGFFYIFRGDFGCFFWCLEVEEVDFIKNVRWKSLSVVGRGRFIRR